MHPIVVQQQKYQEKIRIDILRYIEHHKPQHTLAGTLTFRGYYKPENVNKMWVSFIKKLSPHIHSYCALMDFSKRNPHIHYLLFVTEDVTQDIDLPSVSALHAIYRQSRGKERTPEEIADIKRHRANAGTNTALAKYRSLVRAHSRQIGFGRIMDLWPLYGEPERISTYYCEAYANSNNAKRRSPSYRRKKVVFFPRDKGNNPPRIGLTEFTLLGKYRTKYQTVKLRMCKVMGVPDGDDVLLARALRREKRHLYYIVNGLLNRTPGQPKKWADEVFHEYLHNELLIPYAEMVGAVDPRVPEEFQPVRPTRTYQLRPARPRNGPVATPAQPG